MADPVSTSNHFSAENPTEAITIELPAVAPPTSVPEVSLTQWERMTSGLPYIYSADDTLDRARLRHRRSLQAYNNFPWPDPTLTTDYFGPDERRELLADVFGMTLEDIKRKKVMVEPPFHVVYGTNVNFKGLFYGNVHLVILDDAPITIGERVFCGPRVGIYAATHPTSVTDRIADINIAHPIEIGDDCWIGGGAIINGPSKIGKGFVVAAGAVVRGDFPDYCLIAGVPGRVLKHLDPPTGPPSTSLI